MARGMKGAMMASRPTAPVLAGITWREQYQYYTTRIAGWLLLEFQYGAEGWPIDICGVRIKARGQDAETSAQIAVATAKSLMAKATAELG